MEMSVSSGGVSGGPLQLITTSDNDVAINQPTPESDDPLAVNMAKKNNKKKNRGSTQKSPISPVSTEAAATFSEGSQSPIEERVDSIQSPIEGAVNEPAAMKSEETSASSTVESASDAADASTKVDEPAPSTETTSIPTESSDATAASPVAASTAEPSDDKEVLTESSAPSTDIVAVGAPSVTTPEENSGASKDEETAITNVSKSDAQDQPKEDVIASTIPEDASANTVAGSHSGNDLEAPVGDSAAQVADTTMVDVEEAQKALDDLPTPTTQETMPPVTQAIEVDGARPELVQDTTHSSQDDLSSNQAIIEPSKPEVAVEIEAEPEALPVAEEAKAVEKEEAAEEPTATPPADETKEEPKAAVAEPTKVAQEKPVEEKDEAGEVNIPAVTESPLVPVQEAIEQVAASPIFEAVAETPVPEVVPVVEAEVVSPPAVLAAAALEPEVPVASTEEDPKPAKSEPVPEATAEPPKEVEVASLAKDEAGEKVAPAKVEEEVQPEEEAKDDTGLTKAKEAEAIPIEVEEKTREREAPVDLNDEPPAEKGEEEVTAQEELQAAVAAAGVKVQGTEKDDAVPAKADVPAVEVKGEAPEVEISPPQERTKEETKGEALVAADITLAQEEAKEQVPAEPASPAEAVKETEETVVLGAETTATPADELSLNETKEVIEQSNGRSAINNQVDETAAAEEPAVVPAPVEVKSTPPAVLAADALEAQLPETAPTPFEVPVSQSVPAPEPAPAAGAEILEKAASQGNETAEAKEEAKTEEPKQDVAYDEVKVEGIKEAQEEEKLEAPKPEKVEEEGKEEVKVEELKEEPKIEEPAEEVKLEQPKEDVKVEEPKEETTVEETKDKVKIEENNGEGKVKDLKEGDEIEELPQARLDDPQGELKEEPLQEVAVEPEVIVTNGKQAAEDSTSEQVTVPFVPFSQSQTEDPKDIPESAVTEKPSEAVLEETPVQSKPAAELLAESTQETRVVEAEEQPEAAPSVEDKSSDVDAVDVLVPEVTEPVEKEVPALEEPAQDEAPGQPTRHVATDTESSTDSVVEPVTPIITFGNVGVQEASEDEPAPQIEATVPGSPIQRPKSPFPSSFEVTKVGGGNTPQEEESEVLPIAAPVPVSSCAAGAPLGRSLTPSYSVHSQGGSPLQSPREVEDAGAPFENLAPTEQTSEIVEKPAETAPTAPAEVTEVASASTGKNFNASPAGPEEATTVASAVPEIKTPAEEIEVNPAEEAPAPVVAESAASPVPLYVPPYSVSRQGSPRPEARKLQAEATPSEEKEAVGTSEEAPVAEVVQDKIPAPPSTDVFEQLPEVAPALTADNAQESPQPPKADSRAAETASAADREEAKSTLSPLSVNMSRTSSDSAHLSYRHEGLSITSITNGASPLILPDLSAGRKRLESTASSKLFPGGWISAASKIPDESRPSLETASGEFVANKSPVSPVIEANGATLPPISTADLSPASPAENGEQSTTSTSAHKRKWCVVM